MKKKQDEKLKEGSENLNKPCTGSEGANDSKPQCSDYVDESKEQGTDREREIYEDTSDVESLVKTSAEKNRKATKVQLTAVDVEVKSVSVPKRQATNALQIQQVSTRSSEGMYAFPVRIGQKFGMARHPARDITGRPLIVFITH